MGCTACWLRLRGVRPRNGLVVGVLILLLVDVIWVGSAAITRVRSPRQPDTL